MGVAIVGSTVRDVVHLPGHPPVRKTGGSPVFAARALADIGVRPGIATRCDDAALAAPIAELASPLCLRLDATVVQSELRYRDDGERDHTLAGLGEAWSEDDITGWAAPALREASWVHAGTQRGGDLGPGVLAALAAGGRCVALDAQGPLRRPEVGPIVLSGTLDATLLRHVQALKLSEHEALAAYGTIDAVAIRARCEVPEVLVTFGAYGAAISCEQGSGQVSSQAVTGVDPTGAGDAFLAGYAHARGEGREPMDAGRAACDGVSALLAARALTAAQARG
ncbi:MAG TPA: PfkB family carbohydrate kinase [Gaiellales bacterium]|jgi:sugar/nucleoside kinase (ribokinase family)|nr:PfkB family carbohydrate kinase [Gaiellales bacterium]